MSLLECKSLVFGFGPLKKDSVQALSAPFDFELLPGEVVMLMGENGCGKSTFLKTLAGMLPPLSGEVTLLEKKLWTARERAKQLALVRMSQPVPDRMTVYEFVGLGRMPYAGIFDGRNAEDRRVIEESLDVLSLRSFATRFVSELSDGERSRVYLAEALAQQVQVLLLDEPNAFLDIPHSRKLFRILRDLAQKRGMGIVVSTHSVEYAERYGDRLMVIGKKENGEGLVQVAKACDARKMGLLDWTEID